MPPPDSPRSTSPRARAALAGPRPRTRGRPEGGRGTGAAAIPLQTEANESRASAGRPAVLRWLGQPVLRVRRLPLRREKCVQGASNPARNALQLALSGLCSCARRRRPGPRAGLVEWRHNHSKTALKKLFLSLFLQIGNNVKVSHKEFDGPHVQLWGHEGCRAGYSTK